MIPKRIQRKRIKGWKMPKNTVYVGRPGYYGNPFTEEICGTKERAVMLYELCVKDEQLKGLTFPMTKKELKASNKKWKDFADMPSIPIIQTFLKGKHLACWCKIGDPCHADILLKLANE